MLHGEVGESFKAYGASGHRHLPEIRQGLSQAAGTGVGVTFVPHLVPMIRGIEATLYAELSDAADFDRRSEEHTSELQSRPHLVCRLLLEKKKYARAAQPGVGL